MALTPTSGCGRDVSFQAIEGPIKEKLHQEIRSVAAPAGRTYTDSPGQEPVILNVTAEEEAREALRSGVDETDLRKDWNDKDTLLSHTADDGGGRQGVTDMQPPLNAPKAPRSFGCGIAGRDGIPANTPKGPRSFYAGHGIRGDGPAASNGVPPNTPTGPRAMYRSNPNPYRVVKRDLRR